ncbi:MAG: hypothetical protein HKN25_15130 [Pyrinomonadaceae bacterium]|nr:hypothetical protein [Pyrinomonadaceae bacterium]
MEIINENSDEYQHYVETYQSKIEKALEDHRPQAPSGIDTAFDSAVDHVLSTEELRITPMLTLLGAELVGGKADDVLPTAAAVEFIFQASHIFSELPCMGNDKTAQEYKGLHEEFGEDLAVLIGIGLLNASYPLVFVNHGGMPERALQAHSEIVECIGSAGLIGKEIVADEAASGAEEFESSGSPKTSVLMRLALRLGAILSGADYIELANLSRFAELLGDVHSRGQEQDASQITLENIADDAKRNLIEDFSSNEARTCLIQLTDSFWAPNRSDDINIA